MLTAGSGQGGGKIGRPIVARLLETKLFHVTILTRLDATNEHDFPPNVIVRAVDYNSLKSLESALQGQDAVVSAMAFEAIHQQKVLVDAAVGVDERGPVCALDNDRRVGSEICEHLLHGREVHRLDAAVRVDEKLRAHVD